MRIEKGTDRPAAGGSRCLHRCMQTICSSAKQRKRACIVLADLWQLPVCGGCMVVQGYRDDTGEDAGGDWVKAKALFDGMVHWGLHRDTITYSSAISALSKSRHWAVAARVSPLPPRSPPPCITCHSSVQRFYIFWHMSHALSALWLSSICTTRSV